MLKKYYSITLVPTAIILYTQYTVKIQVSAKDSTSLWKGLLKITKYKPVVPNSVMDLHLDNQLNEFNSRF